MSLNTSHNKVAEQIINYNSNMVEMIDKINQIVTSTDPSIILNITDLNGVIKQINIPSVGYLKSEIDKLNSNIKSIYNLDNSAGSLISSGNTFKKVVSVDLNKEPNDITSLSTLNNFTISKNCFFDSLLNPQLFIDMDLSGKIENNVRKCLVRRYIVDFENNDDILTVNGQSALNSFNSNFRNINNINIVDFEEWLKYTPGVLNQIDFNYDESIFDLEANKLKYSGLYSVLKVEEDTLNKKLWYHIDRLTYIDNDTSEVFELVVGDELILNVDYSTTRYKITEVSKISVNPKVTLERVDGYDVIPVGVETLKFYSQILYTKKLRVSVGYNERNVVFIKPINSINNIMSKNWSLGVGYWTNDLRLSSKDSDNGVTMEQYYKSKVNDYGLVLKDIVSKKIPNILGVVPNPPNMDVNNLKVVQINKHLTDNSNIKTIKDKNSLKNSLKSEIQQLDESLVNKNKEYRSSRFQSDSAKKQFQNEIDEINKKRESKSKLLTSVIKEILDITNNTSNKETPKFRIRGFWNIPEPIVNRDTDPQEVVQFEISYRYLSLDGRQSNPEVFEIVDNNNIQKTASFSNWINIKTDSRKRVYDGDIKKYIWEKLDESSVDTNNINQLDIPIQPNERVEIKVRSISEVGFPESPLISEWSDIISLDFPDELLPLFNSNDSIEKDALKEDLNLSIQTELSARGLDDHLSGTFILNNKTIHHTSDSISSGFKDVNGTQVNLYDYLITLTNKITALEEIVNKAKGELQVIVYRNNDRFDIKNGSNITFTIECEDYLDQYSGSGLPFGRIYANDIYVIKDFIVKVKNNTNSSKLGLLSNRNYDLGTKSDIYNNSSPQVFWVDNNDDLIFNNGTGETRTQLNNQFLWSVNYEGSDNNIIKLSSDISSSVSSGSLTNVLSLNNTNIGYKDGNLLSFQSSNNSLLDSSKWIDLNPNVASSTKLLTTIHPVVNSLSNIVESNSEKVKSIGSESNEDINIPINIYFKMNSLDNSKDGLNYRYVNLNKQKKTVQHIKKVKFLLEDQSENRPFIFTINFVINRNKVILRKKTLFSGNPTITSSLQDVDINRKNIISDINNNEII